MKLMQSSAFSFKALGDMVAFLITTVFDLPLTFQCLLIVMFLIFGLFNKILKMPKFSLITKAATCFHAGSRFCKRID